MGSGCNDELCRTQIERAVGGKHTEFDRPVVISERTPNGGPLKDLDTECPDPFGERPAGGKLIIHASSVSEAVARCQGLEVLPSGFPLLVDDENLGAGFSRRHGCRKATRAGPDHCDIDTADRYGRGGSLYRWRLRRSVQPKMGLRLDRHAATNLGQAGPLVGAAIDAHQAFEADPHTAKHTAALARSGGAQAKDAARTEGGGDRLALECRHRPAIETDLNRPTRG